MDIEALAAMLGGQTDPQALANALRGQRQVGLLGQLSGDKVLSPSGQGMIKQADFQQGQMLDAAGQQFKAAMEQAQLARQGARDAETERHNRASEAAQRGMAQGAEMALTPQAVDAAAHYLAKTGQMMSLGPRMGAAKQQIINRAAELYPNLDLSGNKGQYQAGSASLKKQAQLLDLTKSWENTGRSNLGVLREISKGLADTGSPFLNKPLRAIMSQAAGDPTIAKFRAAHAAVVNEYAKILSGNTGSGGVTEGARHEAEAMLPLDATPEQIAAAADILETDAGNRLSALTSQYEETKRGLSTAPAPAAAPAPSGGAVRRFTRGPDGKLVEVK